ncbi:MAG: very short patch repair endonuclease [Beijerinckiaceae bacterium]
MPDTVSPEVRSRMMSGIRSKDTAPEMVLRRGLHSEGFRFRLHDRTLPGNPDMVFPRWRAVIFVHGCFWHGHECHLFRWPKSREAFWQEKIGRNRANDIRTTEALAAAGWRQSVVWECALKGRTRRPVEKVIADCAEWLRSDKPALEIRGQA